MNYTPIATTFADDPQKKARVEMAYTFLKTQIVGNLGTVSTSNLPHVSPVYYMVDPNLDFYFITQMNTQKYKDLKFNPIISFSVTDNDSLRTIQSRGKAFVATDEKESVGVINRISQVVKYNVLWTPPTIMHNHNSSATVIKYQPEWLRLADFRELTPKKIEDIFIPILP